MKKIRAFTLAEALLTLTIIGVIAAMILPTIITDVKESAFKAKKQTLALELASVLNEMALTESRINKSESETLSNEPTGDFIVNHMSNYMKFLRICSPGATITEPDPEPDEPEVNPPQPDPEPEPEPEPPQWDPDDDDPMKCPSFCGHPGLTTEQQMVCNICEHGANYPDVDPCSTYCGKYAFSVFRPECQECDVDFPETDCTKYCGSSGQAAHRPECQGCMNNTKFCDRKPDHQLCRNLNDEGYYDDWKDKNNGNGNNGNKNNNKNNNKNKKSDSGLTQLADNAKRINLSKVANQSLYSSIGLYSSLNIMAIDSDDMEEGEEYTKSIYDCGWIQGYKYRDYDMLQTFAIETAAKESYDKMLKFGGVSNASTNGTWAAITQGGVAMLISYNPHCVNTPSEYLKLKGNNNQGGVQAPGCLNIIYDVNGENTPNIVGRDVGFMTVFFGKKPTIASPVFTANYGVDEDNADKPPVSFNSRDEASRYCLQNSSGGEEEIPSGEEYISLLINSHLLPKSISGISTNSGVYNTQPNPWYKDDLGSGSSGFAICTYK